MSAYVPAAMKRLVREKFANRCAYCRTPEALTATHFEIEHIDPRAAGGETVLGNLCLACPMCNRFKSDSSSAIDPVTMVRVMLFHPQSQRWPEHFIWSDDATEIIGLSPAGRATSAALRMNRPAMIRVRRMWVAMGEHPALSRPYFRCHKPAEPASTETRKNRLFLKATSAGELRVETEQEHPPKSF